jgi:hypothetical protein
MRKLALRATGLPDECCPGGCRTCSRRGSASRLLSEALARFGKPGIFNTDQSAQFTSDEFTEMLQWSRSRNVPLLKKRVGGNGRFSPFLPSNARWKGRRGTGPCQALAAEGGGRTARLYKGQASPATIATGTSMGCDSRRRARAKPLAGR